MTWGSWGSHLSTKKMRALIEGAMSLGISTFDHADIYGGYTTEKEFGIAFKESGIARENVQFSQNVESKCPVKQGHSP